MSRQYIQFFYKSFTGATESGKSMRGCNFGKILPIKVQNVTEGKFMFFDKKNSKVVGILLSGTWSLPFCYGNCKRCEHSLSFKKNTITVKAVSQLKCLKELKKLGFNLQLNNLVLYTLLRTWEKFSVSMLAMTFV